MKKCGIFLGCGESPVLRSLQDFRRNYDVGYVINAYQDILKLPQV